MIFDELLFPEESGHKLTILDHSSNQNYDDVFADDFTAEEN